MHELGVTQYHKTLGVMMQMNEKPFTMRRDTALATKREMRSKAISYY